MEPLAVKSRGVEDLISSLPEELLHIILLRLPTIAAAARTSVLSRRWRRVWTYLPELEFGSSPAPGTTSTAALMDSIDATINCYSAPTLGRFKIDMSDKTYQCDVSAHRVARWLLFASQRLAGELYIHLPYLDRVVPREEVSLPVCERATEIHIYMGGLNFVLRPPPTGCFTALTNLAIVNFEVDGGEPGHVVTTQCPRLQKLCLRYIGFVADASVLSIRSESLERLEYYEGGLITKCELEVTAPILLEICIGSARATKAYIFAPKLEKVEWRGSYNPDRHQFAVAPRHLRSLSIMYSTWLSILISSTMLRQIFDTVIELTVVLAVREGIAGYMSFLQDMDKLPACETLIIRLLRNRHALAPMMLPLLRRCSCIRKLKLLFDWRIPSEMTSCTTTDCPCLLPDSCQLDDTTFESLEEIGISFFSGSTEEENFVKLLLSRCNMETLKRVSLTVPYVPVSSQIMEVVERIHSMCYPKENVQFNVLSVEARKPFAI